MNGVHKVGDLNFNVVDRGVEKKKVWSSVMCDVTSRRICVCAWIVNEMKWKCRRMRDQMKKRNVTFCQCNENLLVGIVGDVSWSFDLLRIFLLVLSWVRISSKWVIIGVLLMSERSKCRYSWGSSVCKGWNRWDWWMLFHWILPIPYMWEIWVKITLICTIEESQMIDGI